MKRIFLLSIILASVAVSAQTVDNRMYYENTNAAREARRERVRDYRRQSSELQDKITALGSVANQTVYIPVLFGVARNNISPNFGDLRAVNRKHEGEDIMAASGTPIVSPTAAVVLRVGTGETEGLYVYTANPGGETFVYMHLDRIGENVTEGAVLSQGSLIGYVGNTGNASAGPAHLHFEIHNSNGDPTDPYPRLTGELTIQEKINYLTNILNVNSNPVMLAELLVKNFKGTFIAAQAANIPLPTLITNALPVVVAAPSQQSGNVLVIITRNLSQGMSGTDVLALQKTLNARGFIVAPSGPGSIGKETMLFGPATKAAVIKFQISQKISPTVGYVGPVTRAALRK